MKTERIKLERRSGSPQQGSAGFPSCRRHPSKPLDGLEQSKFREYHKQGGISVRSPKSPGKDLLIFRTYYGPNNPIE